MKPPVLVHAEDSTEDEDNEEEKDGDK